MCSPEQRRVTIEIFTKFDHSHIDTITGLAEQVGTEVVESEHDGVGIMIIGVRVAMHLQAEGLARADSSPNASFTMRSVAWPSQADMYFSRKARTAVGSKPFESDCTQSASSWVVPSTGPGVIS